MWFKPVEAVIARKNDQASTKGEAGANENGIQIFVQPYK